MKVIFLIGALIMWNQVIASPLREGVYKMTVDFAQGQTFTDYLNVESEQSAVFTVPGNFTSRVKLEGSGNDFSFLLTAKEGSREIFMNFKGSSTNSGTSLAGKILEPNTNRVIGEFKGDKLYESRQDCGDSFIPY